MARSDRFLILLMLALSLVAGPLFCHFGAAADATPAVIRVVTDNNYPPFTFQDGNGNLQGIAVDQWRLFEEKTGIPVEITGLPWQEAQARLLAGDFDVIDTMGYTEERGRQYDFLRPYARIDVPIFFNKEIPGISGPDSLGGFVVGVQAGDSVIPLLRSHNVTSLKEYASYNDIIRDAKEGNIYVFSMDRPSALYFMHRYGIVQDFRETAPLYSTDVHRAVRKGNPLLPVLQAGFDRISPAEYKAIDDKWLGTPLVDPALVTYFLMAVAGIIFLAVILGVWIYVLRRSVAARTRELQEELFRRSAAEQELARTNRTLQLFGRLLQEEFKTSLFSLRARLALVIQSTQDPEVQKTLAGCDETAATMEELVDSVKTLHGTGSRNEQWNDIQQAFTYARSHHPVLGINFEADIRGIDVFAQPVFESIFSILIGDSLKFGKTVDRITLSYFTMGKSLILRYQDNGTGIPAPEKTRIFLRPEDGGTGHRLAVVQEILLMFGMEITETGEPGQGAQFDILVPEGKYRITGS